MHQKLNKKKRYFIILEDDVRILKNTMKQLKWLLEWIELIEIKDKIWYESIDLFHLAARNKKTY